MIHINVCFFLSAIFGCLSILMTNQKTVKKNYNETVTLIIHSTEFNKPMCSTALHVDYSVYD